MTRYKFKPVANRVAAGLILLAGLLFTAEMTLRLMEVGCIPEDVDQQGAGASAKEPDPLKGWVITPGVRKETGKDESDTLIFTHTPDSTRITSLHPESLSSYPEVALFGCSFTYGYGVTDSNSYPFRVQKLLDRYQVTNRGVPAYSLLQMYLYLHSLVRQGKKPQIAVINYASFQDSRNCLGAQWKFMLSHASVNLQDGKKNNLRIPYINPRTLAKRYDTLIIEYKPLASIVKENCSICHRSALYFLFRLFQTMLHDEKERPLWQPVTERLLKEIKQTCQQEGVELVVATVTNDASTTEILEFCRSEKIPAINISVDLSKPQYHLSWDKGHPSETAYEIYANRLVKGLDSLGIIKP